MISVCIDCGKPTALVDYTDFYFRCPDHLKGTDWVNVERVDIPLTPRELQAALLAADGFTNSEIGEELNLTHGYARNLISNVLTKLDLTKRGQIHRKLREYGL